MSLLEPPALEAPMLEPPLLQFHLFGGCEILLGDRPLPPPRYRKEWWLLALLVIRHDREHSRDTLAAAFWPDSDPDRALLYLRRSLTNLRSALGVHAGRLQSPAPRTLRFDLSGVDSDVAAFDAAVKTPPSSKPTEEALAAAVALYQGPLLPDCTDEWVLPEREERAQAYLNALEVLAQKAQGRGDPAQAASWLRRLLTADPYRESASRALMEVLAEGGDHAAITQVYQAVRRLLRDGLNTDPDPETKALYQRLTERTARPAESPAAAALPAASLRHLPFPLNDLIGRHRELKEVTGWLRRVRLVTLLGTGGVGKTRLSIAAADTALPEFSGGVWFVDLAPVSVPARVPDAVAAALGLSEEAGQSLETRLKDALSSASLLLVLDNCEHVLEACAALSSSLLAACPHLKILATSRQILGMPGEQVYPVPSLELPPLETFGPLANPENAEKNLPALLEYGAVRLFVERARQVNPAFRLTRRNAEAVAGVCHHLDGIPLALELAAARVRSLTPQEIEARLADRFRLLTTGNRTAAPRHQTLRAAIDWSFALLSISERVLLRRLSVFAGGWSLEAAEAVCASIPDAEALGAGNVLDELSGLVDKSLVAATEGALGTRYSLLETVWEYAREHLSKAQEEAAARDQHAAWALALAEEASSHLFEPEAISWLDRLDAEHDNLRSALEWYGKQPAGKTEEQLRLAGTLASFWAARGHYHVGRQMLESALSRLESPGAKSLVLTESGHLAWANALRGAAILASSQGDYPAARARFEVVLALRRELGDPLRIADAINNVGTVTWLQGDLPQAETLYRESLDLYRQLDHTRGIAQALYNIGILVFDRAVTSEDFLAVRPFLEEAITRFSALDNNSGKSYALNALGNLLIVQQDYQAAQAVHEENLTLAKTLNDPLLIADAQAMLAIALSGQGHYTEASSRLKEALARRLEMGDKRNASIALFAAASLLAAQDQGVKAARLSGAIDALREKIGFPFTLRQQAEQDRLVAQVREAVGGAQFAAARTAGQALPWDQAVRDALFDLS